MTEWVLLWEREYTEYEYTCVLFDLWSSSPHCLNLFPFPTFFQPGWPPSIAKGITHLHTLFLNIVNFFISFFWFSRTGAIFTKLCVKDFTSNIVQVKASWSFKKWIHQVLWNCAQNFVSLYLCAPNFSTVINWCCWIYTLNVCIFLLSVHSLIMEYIFKAVFWRLIYIAFLPQVLFLSLHNTLVLWGYIYNIWFKSKPGRNWPPRLIRKSCKQYLKLLWGNSVSNMIVPRWKLIDCCHKSLIIDLLQDSKYR